MRARDYSPTSESVSGSCQKINKNPKSDFQKNAVITRSFDFEYDFFGNLKKVILPNGTIIEYKIDAFNRRVAKLINGQVQNYYVWQGANRLSAVLNRFGQTEMNFIYGIHPIAPVYMMDYRSANGLRDAAHGTRFPILANERGDNRAIINTNDGSYVQEIEYDEYGAILNDSSVTPSRPEGFQPLGFVGGLTDRQTGLVRFGARDYDPVVGRWTSKDPILFAGKMTNLYGYAFNDPINFIDPSGLAPGDTFSSESEAAGDAINFINPTSISQNREYGGYVYKTPNGYVATNPNAGTNLATNLGPMPPGASASYHTHGAYDSTPGLANNRFSVTDILSDTFSGLNGYLGIYSGEIKVQQGGKFRRGLTCQ